MLRSSSSVRSTKAIANHNRFCEDTSVHSPTDDDASRTISIVRMGEEHVSQRLDEVVHNHLNDFIGEHEELVVMGRHRGGGRHLKEIPRTHFEVQLLKGVVNYVDECHNELGLQIKPYL